MKQLQSSEFWGMDEEDKPRQRPKSTRTVSVRFAQIDAPVFDAEAEFRACIDSGSEDEGEQIPTIAIDEVAQGRGEDETRKSIASHFESYRRSVSCAKVRSFSELLSGACDGDEGDDPLQNQSIPKRVLEGNELEAYKAAVVSILHGCEFEKRGDREVAENEGVLASGFLWRKGGVEGGGEWKQTWCVLKRGVGLMYFHKKESWVTLSSPSGVLRADELTGLHCTHFESNEDKPADEFTFQLVTDKRSYDFKCDTEAALLEWVSSAQQVIATFAHGEGLAPGMGRRMTQAAYRSSQQHALSILPVLKTGFLVKKGGNVANWKRRWFVLQENGGLMYFKKQQPWPALAPPAGTISTASIVDVSTKLSTPSMIYIATKEGRTYECKAETDAGAREWIDAISQVMAERDQAAQDGNEGEDPLENRGDAEASEEGRDTVGSFDDSQSIMNRPSTESVALSVIKSGWLTKRGGKRANWRRRWFVLQEGTGLMYFKTKQPIPATTTPKGVIAASEIRNIVYNEGETLASNNGFCIQSQKRVYEIRADTNESREEWMEALKALVAVTNVRLRKTNSGASMSSRPSEASTVEALSVLKTGFLTKKGNRVASWQRRWFVMQEGVGILYFKKQQVWPTFNPPQGKIDAKDILAVRVSDRLGDEDKLLFFIETPGRVYEMKADGVDAMKDWISAIELMIQAVTAPKALKASSTANTEDFNVGLKSGFLLKQSKDGTTWSRRWFILLEGSGFVYFDSLQKWPSDEPPKGKIPFASILSLHLPLPCDNSPSGGCFRIDTLNRSYVLRSDNIITMYQWLSFAGDGWLQNRRVMKMGGGDGDLNQRESWKTAACDPDVTRRLEIVNRAFAVDEDQARAIEYWSRGAGFERDYFLFDSWRHRRLLEAIGNFPHYNSQKFLSENVENLFKTATREALMARFNCLHTEQVCRNDPEVFLQLTVKLKKVSLQFFSSSIPNEGSGDGDEVGTLTSRGGMKPLTRQESTSRISVVGGEGSPRWVESSRFSGASPPSPSSTSPSSLLRRSKASKSEQATVGEETERRASFTGEDVMGKRLMAFITATTKSCAGCTQVRHLGHTTVSMEGDANWIDEEAATLFVYFGNESGWDVTVSFWMQGVDKARSNHSLSFVGEVLIPMTELLEGEPKDLELPIKSVVWPPTTFDPTSVAGVRTSRCSQQPNLEPLAEGGNSADGIVANCPSACGSVSLNACYSEVALPDHYQSFRILHDHMARHEFPYAFSAETEGENDSHSNQTLSAPTNAHRNDSIRIRSRRMTGGARDTIFASDTHWIATQFASNFLISETWHSSLDLRLLAKVYKRDFSVSQAALCLLESVHGAVKAEKNEEEALLGPKTEEEEHALFKVLNDLHSQSIEMLLKYKEEFSVADLQSLVCVVGCSLLSFELSSVGWIREKALEFRSEDWDSLAEVIEFTVGVTMPKMAKPAYPTYLTFGMSVPGKTPTLLLKDVIQHALRSGCEAKLREISAESARATENEKPVKLSERHWEEDGPDNHCGRCSCTFTQTRRRHHCRKCGNIFCNNCSLQRHAVPEYGYQKPVRVCDDCMNQLVAAHQRERTDAPVVAKILQLCNFVMEEFDMDSQVYCQVFPVDVKLQELSAETLYKELSKQVIQFCDSYGERGISPDVFVLYRELKEIHKSFKAVCSDLELLPLPQLFLPFIRLWMTETEEKVISWTETAIKVEDWHPVSETLLHSHSVVDTFCMIAEAVNFFKDLQDISDPNNETFEVMLGMLSRVISKTLVSYAEHMFQVHRRGVFDTTAQDGTGHPLNADATASGGGSSKKSKKEKGQALTQDQLTEAAKEFTVTEELCVRINNICTLRQNLDKFLAELEEEGEWNDTMSEMCFRDTFVSLKVKMIEFSRAIALSLNGYVHHLLLEVVGKDGDSANVGRKSRKLKGLFRKSRKVPSPDDVVAQASDMVDPLDALAEYLSTQLYILSQHLYSHVFQTALKTLWEVILSDIYNILFPRGISSWRLLTERELEHLQSTLPVLEELFYGDGHSGVSSSILAKDCTRVNTVIGFYTLDTCELQDLLMSESTSPEDKKLFQHLLHARSGEDMVAKEFLSKCTGMKVVEEIWENQRRVSMDDSFSAKALLPNDPPPFTDANGSKKTKESVKLPTKSWTWVDDWTVDEYPDRSISELRGKKVEDEDKTTIDGWEYSMEFSNRLPWAGQITSLGMVRRRRWSRMRQLIVST